MDNAARFEQVKAFASEFAEPFRSATLAMPANTIVTYNTMAYWVSVPWDNRGGRVTLAGDAAHPMPPCKVHRYRSRAFGLMFFLQTGAESCD
jgi:2-polyprenyl-6-methoxyphenol hydroxylase-like FAD-dependent oxidoreductase